jgi:hypothetical protein
MVDEKINRDRRRVASRRSDIVISRKERRTKENPKVGEGVRKETGGATQVKYVLDAKTRSSFSPGEEPKVAPRSTKLSPPDSIISGANALLGTYGEEIRCALNGESKSVLNNEVAVA